MEKDQALCSAGDRVASVFFVVVGTLQEQHVAGQARSAVQYFQGDCVGEACLFVPPGTHYHLKVTVTTTAWRNELLELTKEKFTHEIKRLVPPLYNHLVKAWQNKETEERWLGFEKFEGMPAHIAGMDTLDGLCQFREGMVETADI